MLNFVICEDNTLLLEKMTKMFESLFIKFNFEAQIVLKTADPKDVLRYMHSNKIDVLVLDIDLKSEISGLTLASEIRNIDKNCYIIFHSGHLEFSLVAYKYKTFDFLPKPLTSERLEETMQRLIEDMENAPKLFIRIDNKNTIINEDEILFIKRDGMKVVFHTISRDYEAYTSFNKVAPSLPSHFLRCHKSFIANTHKITMLEPIDGKIIFEDNTFCEIGPKYKKNILEVVNNYGIY